ncbi:hypothetical protein [Mycobacterium sp. ACS4331]|uniref:hypothetical protein n=1 Tax=Mycobacterium sp. ACS4331 TaxID=1834121 RepID=UPI0007FF6D10|nr:hypothetical protein [Mycobacterium sp. ACS4331]OBF16146.1 hypothetical protein A5727_14415 [Mycobacterium sp. ACS4331]
MPVQHSVLALYGAVSDALFELNSPGGPDGAEPDQAREQARNITGFTGSTGEIGWYGELFRYFGDHPTESTGEPEPLIPPTLEDAVEEFEGIVEGGITSDEDGLAPSWASRAIEAAFVLDSVRRAIDPGGEFEPVLDLVLAATPVLPGIDGGVLGRAAGAEFAETIRAQNITTLRGLHKALKKNSPLHPAIATATIDPRLRKVKDEYCAVVRTSVKWPDVTLAKLKRGINPVNWNKYFGGFFCDMTAEPSNIYGWTPIREEVSGECSRYRLRTPLKFWSALHGSGLFLNYDFDTGSGWPQADKMVLVDNGYIWITLLDPSDPDAGVRVRTSKELLISGMSATALAVMARTMGYATNATDMFRKLQVYKGALKDFTASVAPVAPVPPKDTSTTWPVVVPQLPADIRDEMCRDTNRVLKDSLDDANLWFHQYMNRWHDGIDADDFDDLTNLMSALLRGRTKDAFTTATENFRPKPTADSTP